jgi:small conductance mechanosensitive channel
MLQIIHTWIMESGPRVLGSISILGIGWLLANGLLRIIIAGMERARIEPTLVSFLGSLMQFVFIAVVLVASLSFLGIPTASMLAVLGAAGLAVALSLQSSLSNFASGVILSIFRPFKVGDVIDIGGEVGIVESIEIFYSYFRTPDNRGMVLPNSMIMNSKIMNLTAKDTRRLDLQIGVSYDDNVDQVLRLLRGILAADPRVLKDPAPAVGISDFGENSVNFWVRPWVKRTDYLDVLFDMNKAIKLKFDEVGISIPYPQRTVHLVNPPPQSPLINS